MNTAKASIRIDRVRLGPGESKVYSIPTSTSMHIGIECVNVPNGLVKLQQIDEVSNLSCSDWASRLWTPKDGGVDLRLENHATNEVEIVVFQGKSPP